MPDSLGYQFNRVYGAPIETDRQVSTITARDNIATSKRWQGMLVHVLSENATYELNGGTSNVNWEIFGSGNFFDKNIDDSDDITEGLTNLFQRPQDRTKLDYITVTQAIDLDALEVAVAAAASGLTYKGNWDASSGSFPGGGTASLGDFYYVSVSGTVDSISFDVGDNIIAIVNNASTSTFSGNWSKHDQTDAIQDVVGLTGSISKSALLSALNVEDGATVDMTGEEISTAITTYLTTANWKEQRTKEEVLDFIGDSFSDGTSTRLSIIYDDANDSFDFTVDQVFGVIYADLSSLISNQGSQNDYSMYEVSDASGFSGISTGRAWVRYKGTSAGDETDYIVVSKEETVSGGASKYSETFGNGVLTIIPITHSLGSEDVIIQVRDVSSKAIIECEINIINLNSVNLLFNTAPTTNQYRVTIIA